MLWSLAGASKLTSFGRSHNRDDYVWLRSTGDGGGGCKSYKGAFQERAHPVPRSAYKESPGPKKRIILPFTSLCEKGTELKNPIETQDG
jgi:hypothetical protein